MHSNATEDVAERLREEAAAVVVDMGPGQTEHGLLLEFSPCAAVFLPRLLAEADLGMHPTVSLIDNVCGCSSSTARSWCRESPSVFGG